MSLQSSNRVRLSKVRETTFGEIPDNPVFKAVRQTSSGLAVNPQTTVSNEISPDRQVTDLILTGVQAGGPIGGEVSFLAIDDDLEEVFQGTWDNKPFRTNTTADSAITDVDADADTFVVVAGAAFVPGHLVYASGFANAGNNGLFTALTGTNATAVIVASVPGLVDEAAPPAGASLRAVGFRGAAGDLAAVTSGGAALTSTALNFTDFGLHAGEWVKIGGQAADTSFSGTAANNDYVRIRAVSAKRLDLDVVPANWSADAGAGKTIQIFAGDFLVNGSEQRSNTFERQYLDHSPVTYEYITGQTLSQMEISLQQQAIVTHTETFTGANGTTQNVRVAGATDIPAPTRGVMNSSSNVGRIGFDGKVVGTPNYVMSASFTINNNLRQQNAVSSIGAVGIGNGEFNVTGALETYFGDKSVLDKVLNNTLTSLDFRIGRNDGTKEKYVFDFPSIKLSSGSPNVSGKNTDVMLSANFQAIKDAVLGYTTSVGRFHYTPS